MEKLTFEIITILTERSINGKTKIEAKCIQDNIKVEISIPNDKSNDREFIKKILINVHDNIKEINPLRAGEIL